MLNKIPVVPTLRKITDPMLKSKENIAMYLIQFLFVNPGWTSSYAEGEMMSFRKLLALYGSRDPTELGNHVGTMLTECLNHYFPGEGLTAECVMELEHGYSKDNVYQGNYTITIAVRDKDGVALCPSSSVVASNDGLEFKFLP